jgi:alkyl sulfatase BDS1-like metallo-beta-lactamase superfamily hydrolase
VARFRQSSRRTAIDCTFTDTGDNYRLTLRNGVLVNVRKPAGDDADATIRLPTTLLPLVASGAIEAAMQHGLKVTGDASALQQLLSVLDPGNPAFDIVTP